MRLQGLRPRARAATYPLRLATPLFLIRLGCWEIWKNVQNKTTKLFSVDNTFR